MYYEPKGWCVSIAIVNAVDEYIHTCLCSFPSNTGIHSMYTQMVQYKPARFYKS